MLKIWEETIVKKVEELSKKKIGYQKWRILTAEFNFSYILSIIYKRIPYVDILYALQQNILVCLQI